MEHKNISVQIKVVPNGKQSPSGKLASAEVLFSGDPLDGLRLVGFGIWEKNGGGKNVTFPARQYLVDGQARTFPLLRPIRDDGSPNRLRQLILIEYAAHESAKKATVKDDEFPDLPRP